MFGLAVAPALLYVIGSVMIALALLLIVIILKQTGKEKGLSGSIAGGSAETFFGKSGGNTQDKLLSKLTIIGSILFVVIVVALYVLINWYNLG